MESRLSGTLPEKALSVSRAASFSSRGRAGFRFRHRFGEESFRSRERPGLSLIELIIVVAIVAVLLSVLAPAVTAARGQARAVLCSSNIRQLFLANHYYAQDMGVYCPGAAKFLENLHRWHGTRDKPTEPFDSTRGPLVPYLGPAGAIRRCPSFDAEEIAKYGGGFERGNGGYGYNNAYIGVQLRPYPSGESVVTTDLAGAVVARVVKPFETVMFTDAAFAANSLIEYSFAEPRFHPQFPTYRPDPSIHFRHRKRANVAWCDGHVDRHPCTFTASSGLYRADPGPLNLGWFGDADDNRLFDLE